MIDLYPNATIIYMWLIFMAAFLILHYGIFRPTLKLLHLRRTHTHGIKTQAELLEKESEQLLQACEKKIDEARQIGIQEREQRRMAGEKIQSETLQKGRQAMTAKIEEARSLIEQQSREALLQIRKYSQTISQEIATKILGRSL